MRLDACKSWGWRPRFAAALLFALVPGARGQDAPPPPDRFETAQLVWSTLIAVDHANRTGNYSVLRDLAAPGFQRANDAARLAAIFAKIREEELGLGRVVLTVPVYSEEPRVQENGFFRIKGQFPARPVGIGFDMLFQYVDGAWRLFGIGVAPVAAPPIPEGASPQPVPKPAAPGG